MSVDGPSREQVTEALTEAYREYDGRAVSVFEAMADAVLALLAVPDEHPANEPTMHVYEVGTGAHLCCRDEPVDLSEHIITMRVQQIDVETQPFDETDDVSAAIVPMAPGTRVRVQVVEQ